jgi:WD40 repeat protein
MRVLATLAAAVVVLGVACQPAPMATWRMGPDRQRYVMPDGLRFTSDGLHVIAHNGPGVTIHAIPAGRIVGTSFVQRGKLIAMPAGIDVSPDGRLVAFVTNGKLTVARVPHGNQEGQASLSSHGGVVAFGRQGKYLTTAYATLEVWEIPGLRRITQVAMGRRKLIQALAFSPDGQVLATAGFGRVIDLWDTDTWTLRDSLRSSLLDGIVGRLVFSPDGRHIAAMSSPPRAWTLWNVSARREIWHREEGDPLPASSLAFSPDGCWLVVGGSQGMAAIVDVRDGETALEWRAHDRNDATTAAAISPDGHRLATSGLAHPGIKLWDFDRLLARTRARR